MNLGVKPVRRSGATTVLLALLLGGGLAPQAGAADSLFSFLQGKGEEGQTAEPCTFESGSTDRPAGKGPTPVEIGVRVLDLIAIDDVAQAMTVDFVMFARWNDATLDRQLTGGRSCTLALEQVWNPSLVIVGERQLDSKLEDRVVVGPEGSVVYQQRMIGELRATADLRAFPMDSRTLGIQIVAAGYTLEQVRFRPLPERTGLQPDPSVSNWVFGRETTDVSAYSVEDLGAVASYTFAIEARRRADVYLWRLAVPILLIVVMSWIPFWMPPVEMGARNSLASLAMLNMIAFQFVLRGMLPPVSYMTVADTVATGALVLIFLALLESTTTGVLEFRGKGERAHRINQLSRVVFPVAALAIALLALPN